MPPRPDNTHNDGYESDSSDDNFFEEGARRVRSVWRGFIDFAFQGNVLEIAFGLMYVLASFPSLTSRYLP